MYYLKKAGFPFIYIIFSSLIALGISGINGNSFTKYSLLSVNLILYLFINAGLFHRTGIEAAKTLFNNDVQRKEIVRTGKDIPLKTKEEYKAYKGFLFGVVICAPLIAFMFIQSLIWIFGGQVYTFSGISAFLYFNFFGFFCIESSFTVLPMGMFYYLLLFIPIISAITGMGYVMGAKKVIYEKKKIADKQREIYGEKK